MEMSRSTMYQFRIDESEKAETFAVLNDLGMKPAQAIRLFFRQVRQTKSIPFAIEHIPNEATAKALLASAEEKDYKRFDSVEDLFADLRS
jgi:DNA-damage-inducible protein J